MVSLLVLIFVGLVVNLLSEYRSDWANIAHAHYLVLTASDIINSAEFTKRGTLTNAINGSLLIFIHNYFPPLLIISSNLIGDIVWIS